MKLIKLYKLRFTQEQHQASIGESLKDVAFYNREDAVQLISNWKGPRPSIEIIELITKVFESYEEFRSYNEHDVVNSALKKLTPEEIYSLQKHFRKA